MHMRIHLNLCLIFGESHTKAFQSMHTFMHSSIQNALHYHRQMFIGPNEQSNAYCGTYCMHGAMHTFRLIVKGNLY